MDTPTIAAILTLAGGLIGTYTKLQTDLARLKERTARIEKNEESVSVALTRLADSIHRIEKALVKAGLIDIE